MKQFFRRVIDKKARAIDPPVTNGPDLSQVPEGFAKALLSQKQALLDKHDFNPFMGGKVTSEQYEAGWLDPRQARIPTQGSTALSALARSLEKSPAVAVARKLTAEKLTGIQHITAMQMNQRGLSPVELMQHGYEFSSRHDAWIKRR